MPQRQLNESAPSRIEIEPDQIKQSEELTVHVFSEAESDNSSDEHRGNAQGGFKYEGVEDDSPKPTSEELEDQLRKQQEIEEGDGWSANPCPKPIT